MIVLFEKMAMLVTLLASGYVCSKLKLVGPEFNKGLSKLVINFFLVGMILSSVINKEMELTGSEVCKGLAMLFLAQIICFVIAWFSPRLLGIRDGDTAMYRMLVTFMNNGFMGLPIVAAVYGDSAVFFASLSNIPFNLLLYTVGVSMLHKRGDGEKLNLKKVLSAPLVATLVAGVIFAFSIPIPAVIDDTIDTISNATIPLSMMCIGITLGNVPIKDAFVHPRLYALSFVRLIVCPLVVWLVMRMFITNPVILGTIVIIYACPSAVMCTILGIENGRDGIESSEAIFLSTVLSMLTIPLLVQILGL